MRVAVSRLDRGSALGSGSTCGALDQPFLSRCPSYDWMGRGVGLVYGYFSVLAMALPYLGYGTTRLGLVAELTWSSAIFHCGFATLRAPRAVDLSSLAQLRVPQSLGVVLIATGGRYRGQSCAAANPRLQRTRAASPPSPLSRQPLGGTRERARGEAVELTGHD